VPDLPKFLQPAMNLDGEWDSEVLPYLYGVFERDFKLCSTCFNGIIVLYDLTMKDSDKEEGFWHLITKDQFIDVRKKVKERLPDYKRAKRLHWIKPIIENNSHSEILVWNYEEAKGKIHTYLWLKNHDFVVIIKKRREKIGEFYILVTAYYVEYDHTRRKLEDKYRNRLR